MDKMKFQFFSYWAGGYVAIHEIANVLTESATGFDREKAYLAYVLGNSATPEELHEFKMQVKTGDPNEDRILEAVSSIPLDKKVIEFMDSECYAWEEAIRQAAKENKWQCFDLRTLMPVTPDHDRGTCLDVRNVIGWLKSIGYPSWGIETLDEMLRESQRVHDEVADDDLASVQIDAGTEVHVEQLGPRARNTMLKQMGALALLLAEKSPLYRNGNDPNVLQIAKAITVHLELHPDINSRGLSVSNLSANISEGLDLLFRSKDTN